MTHLVAAPVLLPLMAAALLLAAAPRLALQRAIGGAGVLGLLGIAAALVLWSTDDQVRVYALGAWPAPFGIVLVLDRAAALMVAVTAVLAAAAFAAALGGWDRQGRHFHTLFQFQLAGLNGAFLTGDLFNLFVFFEVLLIASYCLLLHGLGLERLRAGLHYVVVNLAASALFLLAVATLYGLCGTLNMADLAAAMARLPAADRPLAQAAGLLLLVVFGVKAALVPLYFWLPAAYSAAGPAVAALFAVMTKLGLYAILRVQPLLFGEQAASPAGLPLLAIALVTLALGTLGAFAAARLSTMAAYFTIVSAGTTLAAAALFERDGVAAALYYLVQSSLALAALFLLSGSLATQRGDLGDRLAAGPAPWRPAAAGLLLLVCALNVAGLPPLSGFIGKLLILQATAGTGAPWVWTLLLASSLLAALSMVRAGSALFWRSSGPGVQAPAVSRSGMTAAIFLAACSVALAAFAAPVLGFADSAAAQLLDVRRYTEAVLP